MPCIYHKMLSLIKGSEEIVRKRYLKVLILNWLVYPALLLYNLKNENEKEEENNQFCLLNKMQHLRDAFSLKSMYRTACSVAR